MALVPGTRLGPYEILAPLGAGGMGEVFRARDTKLGREVALKVLPASVVGDAERLQRFEREAHLLASLNHPRIGAIYGVEDSTDIKALVLELVEGPTLQERIAEGALAVEEALSIARQIAEALEAAHEKGVIHRDLKPQNVKVTPDGEVKVLDFGLAKALDPGTSAAPTTSPTLMNSPTLTAAGTQLGVILGTAAYMAPEQARGGSVDKRADIWAFGVVLWEMLAGRRLFAGDTVTDTLAGVLKSEIEWAQLPAATPPGVRRLLERCLVRDRKQRLHDIGDARLELEEAVLRRERAVAPAEPRPSARGARAARVGGAALAGILLGALGWRALAPGAPSAGRGLHLSVVPPAGMILVGGELSPDGRCLVAWMLSRDDRSEGRHQLFLRRLDRFEFTLVPESEGATREEFSPDGKWLYFTAPVAANATQLRLARVPADLSAGAVTMRPWDSGWSDWTLLPGGDVLATVESGRKFVRVPSSGGEASPPVPFDDGGGRVSSHFFTRARLPDGRPIVGLSHYGSRGYQQAVGAVDLASGKVVMMVDDARGGHWLPSGDLLFGRATGLLVAKLDSKTMVVTGAPRAVLSGLRTQNGGDPYPRFSLSEDGTLAFPPGGRVGSDRRLVTIDASGAVAPWSNDRLSFQAAPAVAGGRARFAQIVMEPNGLLFEIWMSDPDSASLRRLVSIPGVDVNFPVLDRGGQRLAFTRFSRSAEDGIYVRELEGGGADRRVVAISGAIDYAPTAWSADGRWLLANRSVGGNRDIVVIDSEGDPKEPRPLVATSFDETSAQVSPDGRWVAYVSNESGRDEVYVARWLENGSLGPGVAISHGPGDNPRWRPDGKAIVFSDTRDHLVSASVVLGDRASAQTPRVLVDLKELGLLPYFSYLPDGRLLVVAQGTDEGDITQLDVIVDFVAGLGASETQ